MMRSSIRPQQLSRESTKRSARGCLSLAAFLFAVNLMGCALAPSSTPTVVFATAPPSLHQFDGKAAFQHVLAQMEFGRRDAGTPGNHATSDYIIATLHKANVTVETQEFQYKDTPIRNVIGKIGKGPLIIIGAHFDSRKYADQDKVNPRAPVPAANDGASGVSVLLELARTLDLSKLKNEVWLAFFDAEDNGEIDGWDWSIGAKYTAEHLATKPDRVIILDMIGDADQNIFYEGNSDVETQKQLFDVAARLGYGKEFVPQTKWTMIDDHTPFLQQGIRAVDLIDFDYPFWHTTQDTADKVSAASLERVGRVVQTWLEGR